MEAYPTLDSKAGKGNVLTARGQPVLNVITENVYEDSYGYIHVVGEIKNISLQTMKMVRTTVAGSRFPCNL
jgi:hypothetical protein